MSEIKHLPLKEATIPDVPDSRLVGLPFEQVTRDIRLWWKLQDPNESAGAGKHYGFWFYAGANVQGSPLEPGQPVPDDIWYGDEVQIECVFHGIAYYDGLRHLWMGDKRSSNEGYLYYADVRDLIEVLKAIDALEQRFLDPEDHQRT